MDSDYFPASVQRSFQAGRADKHHFAGNVVAKSEFDASSAKTAFRFGNRGVVFLV